MNSNLYPISNRKGRSGQFCCLDILRFFAQVCFQTAFGVPPSFFCKKKSCRMRQDSTIKTHEFTLKTQRILSCKSCRHQGVNATSRDRLKDWSYFIRLTGDCQGIRQSILQSLKNGLGIISAKLCLTSAIIKAIITIASPCII